MRALLNAETIAVNPPNAMGLTPLYMACHRGHADVVRTLLATHDLQVQR